MKQLDAFKDCLFHGSPHPDLKILNPNAATDTDAGNDFNNAHALFASDNVGFAIPFSLMNKASLPDDIGSFDWSVGSMRDDTANPVVHCTFPQKLRSFIENAVGTVYVLPKETFAENNGLQWKSRNEVVPISSFEVTIQDFYRAGGVVNWEFSA